MRINGMSGMDHVDLGDGFHELRFCETSITSQVTDAVCVSCGKPSLCAMEYMHFDFSDLRVHQACCVECMNAYCDAFARHFESDDEDDDE